MPTKNELLASQKQLYCFLVFVIVALLITALIFNAPAQIWRGNGVIHTSTANLITDYFELANIGAALVNAAMMAVLAIIIIRISKTPITGALVAAILTVVGFSLFGKNLYNSLPIIAGVFAYCRLTRQPFDNWIPSALFGTALGPLVSEISYNFGLATGQGILAGQAVGLLVGFSIPVLAQHFAIFHKGLSLYNIGFTAGIIGTFCIATFRALGLNIEPVYIVSGGNNWGLSLFLFGFLGIMLCGGLALNAWSFKGFKDLTRESGRGGVDFIEKHAWGLVLINMSLLGLLATFYVLLVGGELNGPSLGGIFTIIGFGAFGKHPKNIIPVLLGVYLAAYFSTNDISATPIILAALFGTTLAPVAGYYGFTAGVVAGGLHLVFTANNLSLLHGGVNLYNNGFSGGFVAFLILPILNKIRRR